MDETCGYPVKKRDGSGRVLPCALPPGHKDAHRDAEQYRALLDRNTRRVKERRAAKRPDCVWCGEKLKTYRGAGIPLHRGCDRAYRAAEAAKRSENHPVCTWCGEKMKLYLGAEVPLHAECKDAYTAAKRAEKRPDCAWCGEKLGAYYGGEVPLHGECTPTYWADRYRWDDEYREQQLSRRRENLGQRPKGEGRNPDDPAWLYVLLNESGESLYIGQTAAKPQARYAQHRYEHWWADLIAGYRAYEVTYRELDYYEGVLIHAFHPLFNRRCPRCCPRSIDRRRWSAIDAGEMPLTRPGEWQVA